MDAPSSTRRLLRAAAAVTSLTLAATACTDPNWSPNLGGADVGDLAGPAAEVPATPETVRGWVTYGQPVIAATVVVLDQGGEPVGEPASTDDFGYFETDVAYGPDYEVVATGGTVDGADLPVTLRTRMNTDDVEATANIGHIDINLATTLVAEHLERHPGLDEEDAEAHVATALGVDPGTDIGATVGVDPSTFHPSALVALAQDGVPTDGTVDEIADGIAAGETDVAAFTLGNPIAGMVAGIVKGFIQQQGIKLLTNALGLEEGDETVAELRALRGQLDSLQRALVEASQRAHQVAVEGIYAAAVDATNDVRGGVRTASRLYLEPIAERAVAVQEARAARAKVPADAADARAAADAEVARAEAAYQVASDNFRNNYNTLAGGAFVKLNLFLESGPGDAKSIVAKYADVLRPRRFISKADSDALFAVYEDFAGWQATAAHLEAEYQSAIRGNVAGAIRLYEEAVARQEAQLPNRLGTAGVVVDVATGRMWSAAGTPLLHWSPPAIGFPMPPAPDGLPAAPAGFTGWRLPANTELADLVRDRGTRTARDYMVSISKPTGFDRNWWSAAGPIWSNTEGWERFQIGTSPTRAPSNHMSHNRSVLDPNGTWRPLPYLGPGQAEWEPKATQHINQRYAEARAHVVWIRTLGPGERYL